MRKFARNCWQILFSLFVISCRQDVNQSSLTQIKKLNYPSASAIEYYGGKLYIMGDDAPDMIILDTNLNVIDSISIILHTAKRIPKEFKPDIEASAIYLNNNEPEIYLFGSGSSDPYRNAGWVYHINTKAKNNIYLQPLYSKINEAGIKQLNIEGAGIHYNNLILANRGNKSYPENHLIIGTKDLIDSQGNNFSTIPVITNNDTANFSGISGLFFVEKFDVLIMTVSTEDTRSVYEDGTIGKSYLWIIDNFIVKKDRKSISPDRIIDLEKIDKRFKGSKIESGTVIKISDGLLHLALVADNDDGTSTVFKMSIGLH